MRYGKGNLAGVVLFDRDTKPVDGVRGQGRLLAGSWGRVDALADATIGKPGFFLRVSGTHSEANDYRDGDGRQVHSAYQRQSLNLLGGWLPDADTRLELSAVRSEAEAAYADRNMDGVIFDRDGLGIRLEKKRLSELWRKLELQASYNYIDHAMDNYTLCAKAANMAHAWNNPDRETYGLRALAELALSVSSALTLGADRQKNTHAAQLQRHEAHRSWRFGTRQRSGSDHGGLVRRAEL